jgi:menaquinone-dependent protoporphyrinogen IX oxidase
LLSISKEGGHRNLDGIKHWSEIYWQILVLMRTVVIYKSKTGFVRKYAEWISEELSADMLESKMFTIEMFPLYDTIIYGGGLYVGGINGVKLILKNLDRLADKKILIFASGATPNREITTNELINLNFTPSQQSKIRFFYLRGGFDYSKLGIIDKVLMTLLKMKMRIKNENKRTPDEKGMLSAYEAPCDFTKKRYIDDLVSFAKTGMQKKD